jgi:hypothetical protein
LLDKSPFSFRASLIAVVFFFEVVFICFIFIFLFRVVLCFADVQVSYSPSVTFFFARRLYCLKYCPPCHSCMYGN